ncbi:unnamed protein product [Phytomonas sp. EM1]|nr:unnamed protein product [Phytomonas sp. EM1]|eukprot:CCW60537.1 unnamed protein product [Phytomonas sp. isolate EM1]
MLWNKLIEALKKCDKCSNYTALCRTFDAEVLPEINHLLRSPLLCPVRDDIIPDGCSAQVAEVREALSDPNSEFVAADDVWFFLFKSAASVIDRQLRKRRRLTISENIGETKDSYDKSLTEIIVNTFVLFCNRGLPNLEHMSLRWAFLKKERQQFEAGDAYVNSNASERRKLLMNSVLSVFSERAHKHFFSAVWMRCIEYADEASLHIHLLHRLAPVILPNLNNPLLLADYLSSCFSSGGLISVMALQGLFVLMLDHGLEYPQFYEQLYSLITPDAFASRHRYQMFQLLFLSMTSFRVPSYIAASVVKKVLRISLAAPAPVLSFVLPFTRKVLQIHPNCLALIHRTSKEAVLPEEGDKLAKDISRGQSEQLTSPASENCVEEKKDSHKVPTALSSKQDALRQTALLFEGKDPFDPEASLPSSNALNSTLWELTALERHYLPAVPLMISAFGSSAEDKTPLRYEKTYARLFTAEITRPLSKDHLPTVAYHEPQMDPLDDLVTL